MYSGGTVVTLGRHAGKLVTTSPTALTFESSGSQLVISFAKIDSYEYFQQGARHLGAFPAIATGLVRHRQKRHFLRVSYKEESGAQQFAIFEVPKQMPRTLLAIVEVGRPGDAG